jgi:hypothetical protein
VSAQKPSIGNIPLGDYNRTLVRMKQNLDMLTGRVGGELEPLPSTATTADMINAINTIIARLNASTN